MYWKKEYINENLIAEIFLERVERFNKKCTSPRLIYILNNIPLILYINNKSTLCYGMSEIVYRSEKKLLKRYKINPKEIKSVIFENRHCYFVIEICPKTFYHFKTKRIIRKELSDTVGHELAHILEFFVYGYSERFTTNWHNKNWKNIAKIFGCRELNGFRN